MKLDRAFIQLPVSADADRLAEEVSRFGEEHWRPHPQGFAGNSFLPLIAANGDPASEALEGPMRPTPLLEACGYLQQVLSEIGATWGRSRLMRLSGHAEVTAHVDVNYYWRERVRVHIPIVTQPTVRFLCDDQEVNMKPGECWIFDTWRLHNVINDAERARIHLVADTVGSGKFWSLVEAGSSPDAPKAGWAPRLIAPAGTSASRLELETVNTPVVMSVWELRHHLDFLLGEAEPSQAAWPGVRDLVGRFVLAWQGLWHEYGESEAGWPRYYTVLENFAQHLQRAGAGSVMLRNRNNLLDSVVFMVLTAALSARARAAVEAAKGLPPSKPKVAYSA